MSDFQEPDRGNVSCPDFDLTRELPFLRLFPPADVDRFLRRADIVDFVAGESIIREGREDPYIFFLIQGQVIVSKQNVKLCELRRLGDMFGEMRFLDGKPRSATVTAKCDAVCLRLDLSLADAARAEDMAVTLALIYRTMAEVLSERLRKSNNELLYLRGELARRGEPRKPGGR